MSAQAPSLAVAVVDLLLVAMVVGSVHIPPVS
jgi:hypothetical protein